jgi:hypothetical protein
MKNITNKDVTLKKMTTDQLNKVVLDGIELIGQGEQMAGEALLVLKEEKRFLEKEHGTANWEQYCKKYFPHPSSYSYKLMEGAKALRTLSVPQRKQIKNAAAALALAKIPVPARKGVVKKAASTAKDGKATAKAITANAPPRKDPPKPKGLLDYTGIEIPRECVDEFVRAKNDIIDLVDRQSEIIGQLQKYQDDNDLIFAEVGVGMGNLIAKLKGARQEIELAIPYAVCPSCQGKLLKDCATCKERGFVSKFYYMNFIPEETRNIREGK